MTDLNLQSNLGLQSNIEFSVQNSLRNRAGSIQKMQSMAENGKNNDEKALMEAAQEFESVFVHQMLEAMDKTIDRSDSFLSGGSAEDYFRSMMHQEMAKNISHGNNGFGLAEAIYKQMAGNLSPKSAP
ncbi:MAG: rod-binding protein [Cyanobacteria bacterium P01_H01_bin.74]